MAISLPDDELLALLADDESDRVERKESANDKDAICRAICAFANDLADHRKPGVLFVGVKDNGSCAGLTVTDRLLTDLAGIRADGNVLPLPSLSVEKRVLGGCEVAVVSVEPSIAPPVRYRGVVHVRVGSRQAHATPQDELRLTERRQAYDQPWEMHPLSTAAIDDLDMALFERTILPSSVAAAVLAENGRTVEAQLAALRFVGSVDQPKPTVLGMLLIGVQPTSFIPGSYIQFLRIDGERLTDPILDQKEISGAMPDMLRQLDDLLRLNISIQTTIADRVVEEQRPSYPFEALRQIAINALIHRDYRLSNAPTRIYWFRERVEIWSPGGPYGVVSTGTFGSPDLTDYRNPGLASAMKDLGYVQKFGWGIQKAQQSMTELGLRPIEFDVSPAAVNATFRQRK